MRRLVSELIELPWSRPGEDKELSVADACRFSPVESRQPKLKTGSTIEKPAVQPKTRHRC